MVLDQIKERVAILLLLLLVLFCFNSLKSTPGKKSASIDNYAFVKVAN